MDSNHRRHCQQIYSLSPLATREHPHMHLTHQKSGAGRRIRTPDLLITNQLLYRLSYTSRKSSEGYNSKSVRVCQHENERNLKYCGGISPAAVNLCLFLRRLFGGLFRGLFSGRVIVQIDGDLHRDVLVALLVLRDDILKARVAAGAERILE